MPVRVLLGIAMVLLLVLFFDRPTEDTLEQKEEPVVSVLQVELEPDVIELAESTDSSSVDSREGSEESTSKETKSPLNASENVSHVSSISLSADEREYNAMVVRERREAKIERHKIYNRARNEWRKELKAARVGAQESGDYTRVKELEANRPNKNDPTLYF